MKKPNRSKLSFATETVRTLSINDLVQVQGGALGKLVGTTGDCLLASKVESCVVA